MPQDRSSRERAGRKGQLKIFIFTNITITIRPLVDGLPCRPSPLSSRHGVPQGARPADLEGWHSIAWKPHFWLDPTQALASELADLQIT